MAVSVAKLGWRDRFQKAIRESAFVLLVPVAGYLLVALASFDAADPGWSHSGSTAIVQNWGGRAGAWLADLLLYLIGRMAFLLPLVLLWYAWRFLRDPADSSQAPDPLVPLTRLAGVVLALLGGAILGHAQMHPGNLPGGSGGVLGRFFGDLLVGSLGRGSTTMFALMMFLIGSTFATGVSWFRAMDKVGAATLNLITRMGVWRQQFSDWRVGQKARAVREVGRKEETVKRKKREPVKIESVAPVMEKSERAERELQIPLFTNIPSGELPPLSLLDEARVTGKGYSPEALEALSRQVELKLKDFRIEARVVGVYPGPVITRFELEPAPGIRGSQISSLDKDIARGLSVVSVRVVDVIPGKSVVGLEIPNQHREMVFLSEILRSKEYDKASSVLTLALGKDIGGRPSVVDVAKMPHLLVAGTTGSGKSVALNAMIVSLLYKATAKDVRMIMIDPKMLELSVYEGIPHLLAPVVTDMKEASNALRWCVAEMERRYKLMAAVGVRNLAGYNRKVRDAHEQGQPIPDPLFNVAKAAPGEHPKPLETMPHIVVVIDEFADMMMVARKNVEELIARLAQKARAAGIHLILATQRPSVDVITGLIKANIPTRVAFQVSSKIDSRTILDQSGAETLLGNGDMLYLPPGTANTERVHGAYVSDDEVHRVVKYLRENHGKPDYLEGILDETQELGDGRVIGETGLPEEANGEADELYDMAVRIVTETRRASISGVQRRLKIGYNRAARLIEEMEAAGIVSAPEHNGNRTVLAPPPPKD
ncbi:MAG: DNA translocase FtsK 4TM domain-containing protein [Rhodanobacteraceae bacterium]|nr:DNA translocase FtsK 4TM domain-containing protein [Rhodanobacteraceae bacterium]